MTIDEPDQIVIVGEKLAPYVMSDEPVEQRGGAHAVEVNGNGTAAETDLVECLDEPTCLVTREQIVDEVKAALKKLRAVTADVDQNSAGGHFVAGAAVRRGAHDE